MGVNTLPRDYDIARIIADYEQRISYLERQLLGLAYLTPEFTAVQAARLTRNAVQSINNNALTPIQFNAEVFDESGMHDNAVNNSRITIAVPGRYEMGMNVEFVSAADYTRFILAIRLNGGSPLVFTQTPPVAANLAQRYAVSTMTQLAAGDYIEAEVLQQNAAVAARNLALTANYSPIFYAARIGS